MKLSVILLIFTSVQLALSSKSLDVLRGSLPTSRIQEDEILAVLSQNKTDTSENFTFVELIGGLRYETVLHQDPSRRTNPYYGWFFFFFLFIRAKVNDKNAFDFIVPTALEKLRYYKKKKATVLD